MPRAAAAPVFLAALLPRLVSWRTNMVLSPKALTTASVPSLEASSTTMTSIDSAPSRDRSAPIVLPITPAASWAGMTRLKRTWLLTAANPRSYDVRWTLPCPTPRLRCTATRPASWNNHDLRPRLSENFPARSEAHSATANNAILQREVHPGLRTNPPAGIAYAPKVAGVEPAQLPVWHNAPIGKAVGYDARGKYLETVE